ncbi:hypothetical protein QPK87_14385 [Kamptonema cortianum]|jgi:hypothetical protein|nr:hypothetical protein [Geitlerinema splendidum]MDK3157754.1 hypothetical protein [Kamptonema cortianum]
MAEAKIKPRWESWENLCIKKSLEEKIQLKIIALALGKTLNAVSKKITHMGLRKISSKPGRRKGKRASPALKASTFTEIERMRKILSLYAPRENLKKSQEALEKGAWVTATPLFLKEKEIYSLQSSPAYILIKGKIPDKLRKQKVACDPTYITARHIENWTTSEGFCLVGGNLIKQGLYYWKEGRYFSKAQILMHMNRFRLENSLQPVALYEDVAGLACK